MRMSRNLTAERPVAVVPAIFATDAVGTILPLGRGGSYLTAVVLAEGLKARRCELLQGVPGYFPGDPHRDPPSRHPPTLTFDEALALAYGGCDLVERNAIEAAVRSGLPMVVRPLEMSAPLNRIPATAGERARRDPVASGAAVH
jgi:aspartokinase